MIAPRGVWRARVLLATRLVLGAVFIYASADKILYPAAFAETIYNYQLLPLSFIPAVAVWLPWVELLLGVCLVVGVWQPGAVFTANILLLAFMGALIFNLTRGLDIDCGCFGSSQGAAGRGASTGYVLRDAFFLFMALYLAYETCAGVACSGSSLLRLRGARRGRDTVRAEQ